MTGYGAMVHGTCNLGTETWYWRHADAVDSLGAFALEYALILTGPETG